MTPESTTVALRRDILSRAVENLLASDLRLLLYLIVEASPYSGRVFHPLSRLATDLGIREEIVKVALRRLADLGFIEEHPPWIKNVLTIDLGPLFIRGAPEDIPIEPHFHS